MNEPMTVTEDTVLPADAGIVRVVAADLTVITLPKAKDIPSNRVFRIENDPTSTQPIIIRSVKDPDHGLLEPLTVRPGGWADVELRKEA